MSNKQEFLEHLDKTLTLGELKGREKEREREMQAALLRLLVMNVMKNLIKRSISMVKNNMPLLKRQSALRENQILRWGLIQVSKSL